MTFVLLLILARTITATFVDDDVNFGALDGLMAFCILATGITMTVSRCCIPACCPDGMEAIPKPCPPTCFVCLDCPYIGLATWVVIVFLLELFLSTDAPKNPKVLRLLRLVPIVLAIVALVTAIKKACDMGMPKDDPKQGMVVGTPVQAEKVG